MNHSDFIKDRLSRWSNKLQSQSVPHTPIILISVLDQQNGGVRMDISENMSVGEAIVILKFALSEAERRVESNK